MVLVKRIFLKFDQLNPDDPSILAILISPLTYHPRNATLINLLTPRTKHFPLTKLSSSHFPPTDSNRAVEHEGDRAVGGHRSGSGVQRYRERVGWPVQPILAGNAGQHGLR